VNVFDRLRRLEETVDVTPDGDLTDEMVIEQIARLEAGLQPTVERWQVVQSLMRGIAELHITEGHAHPKNWQGCPTCQERMYL